MKLLSLAIPSLLLFAACGNDTAVDTDVVSSTDSLAMATNMAGITLTPKQPGVDFGDATITSWKYANGTFDYGYDASTYKLGEQTPDTASTSCANSAKGQHIHLIVDNEPYIAKYEPKFEQEIADGEHHILTFLSRSYHESIKTDQAHKAETVAVANGSFGKRTPITEPMLFYSRPKGTYTGKDTEELLLDFYPVNAELGDDFMVKVEVGGETFTVDEWQPYLLRGLPMGDNTVTLTLVDGDGVTVDAPFNPVSRTFTLAADPMPEG